MDRSIGEQRGHDIVRALDGLFSDEPQPGSGEFRYCVVGSRLNNSNDIGVIPVPPGASLSSFRNASKFMSNGASLIVASSSHHGGDPLSYAVKIARFAIYSRLLPFNRDVVVCAATPNLLAPDEDGTPPLPDSVSVFYDEDGVTGKNPTCPSGNISPGPRTKLIWTGPLPAGSFLHEILEDTARKENSKRVVDDVVRAANSICPRKEKRTADWFAESEYDMARQLLVAIGYGHISSDSLPKPSSWQYTPTTPAARWINKNVVFTAARHDRSIVAAGLPSDISLVKDIAEIWKHYENIYGFDISLRPQFGYSEVCALGKMLGIDSAIEARAQGVELSDILA